MPIFYRSLQYSLSALLPFILILGGVRLAMTSLFLRLIYNRPNFPPDLYGWSEDVRLEYGPYGVHYLTQNQPISYLAELQIEGQTAFNPDELAHMEDVQVVTVAAFRLLTFCLIVFVLGALLLLRRAETRPYLGRAIQQGGLNTLLISGLLLGVALLSWDFLFDTFHDIFFEAGTWQFRRDDTLIRLYPPQFWFDAGIAVGLMGLGGALLCALAPWLYGRWRARRSGLLATGFPHD